MKRNDGDGVIPSFLNVFDCFMRKTDHRLKYSLKILSSIKYHAFHSNLAQGSLTSAESATHRKKLGCLFYLLLAYTGTSHTSRTTGVMYYS